MVNNLFKNKVLRNKYSLSVIIFLVSCLIRLVFLFSIFPDNRHSFAEFYGSTAIGISLGEGLTYNWDEVKKISTVKDNYSGNFLDYKKTDDRKPFFYTLPGPALTLAALWRIIPIHNFLPYILFQILLDSIIISLFFLLFINNLNKTIVYIITLYLLLNPVSISKTVMVGYDFWAPFCVLINFIGIYYAFFKNKSNWVLLLTGLLTACTLWFRDIINFLPFYIVFGIILYYRINRKLTYKTVLIKVFIYILPAVISLGSLSLYRHHYTGSYRPTQTFFWHAFFCAIGQFDNPYGIRANDMDVWNLGHRLNKDINFKDQFKYSESSNNIYEKTLKKEAINWIKKYPHHFVRNMVYRTTMMISPFFFTKSSSPLKTLFSKFIFQFLGIILFILWILGLLYMFKTKDTLLYIMLPIYLYFFSIFSWYYLIGRVILCFAFLNIMFYIFGIKLISIFLKERYLKVTTTK